jgi:hypothetical protein
MEPLPQIWEDQREPGMCRDSDTIETVMRGDVIGWVEEGEPGVRRGKGDTMNQFMGSDWCLVTGWMEGEKGPISRQTVTHFHAIGTSVPRYKDSTVNDHSGCRDNK